MNNMEISLTRFSLIYVLLLLVLFIMKKCRIDQTKLVFIASMKMTLQLVIAGFLIQYIFKVDNPLFTIIYLGAMITFTIHRILSKNKELNKKFKFMIAVSVSFSGFFVIGYFIGVVIGQNIFNPQFVIPIAGMLLGNTMTAVILGLKSFKESLIGQQNRINALLCAGVSAKNILLPFVKQALETATLPTLNSMLGMGIVFLPGMMTGQILSGTIPITAILYQVAIMIGICTAIFLSCFGALYFGYQTLFDKQLQIIELNQTKKE